MRKREQIKNERSKGITLIALVITIIVLLILAGVTIATLTGENGILTQAAKAKEVTEQARRDEEEKLNMLTGEITGEDESGANHPVLKDGMIAITYNEDGSINELTEEEAKGKKWYAYKITEDGNMEDGGTTNGGDSKWANAILDGNYYVWIPRYAYKIDNSVTYKSQEGESHKIDVKFLSGTSNEVENGYIVHPAFKFGEQELEGIWVGKYETTGTEEEPTILPNQEGLRNMNVSTMFEKARNLSKENIDAHMMKNIEWGAVAYLAQSQYGRNGTEISVNQCENYITGAGRGIGTDVDKLIYNSTYTWENIDDTQKYNGKIGKLSSTTGNIYGIYDMSGGADEYVMGFYQDSEGHIHTGYTMDANSGFNGYLTDGTEYKSEIKLPNEKYYDLYQNTDNNFSNSDSGKEGDATKETKGWNDDGSYFVHSGVPVFGRGRHWTNSNNDGVFYFNNCYGEGSSVMRISCMSCSEIMCNLRCG